MADEAPVIYLHAIERRYHQGDAVLEVLKGAELAVWPGQTVALVAPSGAGKSTLLHIAGLLEQPDGGEVYLDGAPTSGLSDAARDCASERARPRIICGIMTFSTAENSGSR